MQDSPPPLKKSLAASVQETLHSGRGDPVELRRLEAALGKERDSVFVLERALEDKEKELNSTSHLLELRIAELEKRVFTLQEENARLRASANPQNLVELDDIFRVVSRERKTVARDREMLVAEREAFEAEKAKFQQLKNDKVKQGFVLGVAEATEASVIAQRVQQFVRKYADSTPEDIREIRESLEDVLRKKLADLDNSS